MTTSTTPALRLVTTLSAELEALGVPAGVVARASAYEADHRRLCAIERAAREYVEAIDAECDADADGMGEAIDRECDALAALREQLGRWA